MWTQPSLADQAAQQELRARHQVQQWVANRSTFNSRRMWLLVALVWTLAAAIAAVGLSQRT